MSEDTKPPVFTESHRQTLYDRRVLVLDGPLDDDNGALLATQLITLATADPHTDIALWIHSPGGSVPAMLAIRDLIRTIPNDVATTVVGEAVGAAAVLLPPAPPGLRAVLPHARVVLHQPGAQSRGAIPDLIVASDEVVRIRGEMELALARHTGQSVQRLRADTDHDRVFAADAAVAYGLADQVVEVA